MKGKMLPLALLAALLMTVFASAAAEYGAIYTEAETLYSAELEVLGQDHLPQFTETYGIDLRVDVLTSISGFNSVEDAAIAIYEEYDYGYGEGRNGVTLTLLVHEDEGGVALDEWYVYACGDSDELTTNGPWNVYPNLNEIMTEENWSGNAEQDTKALEAAVVGMRDGLEKFVLAGGVVGSIWSPVTGEMLQEEPAAEEILSDSPDSFPAAGETIGYVTDTAGIMTAEERQLLTQAAKAVSEKHGFGVYIITVDSFRDVIGCSDVFDGAEALYRAYNLGDGDEHKGVLLLLSMTERDYSLITYSDYGNFVFDEATREEMTYFFLDDFRYDDWYTGFADYVKVCDEFLTDGPDKLSSEITAKTGIIFLVPLIVAAVVIAILNRRMKSVFKATEAEAYADGGLDLTRSYDQFTHATETRRKRKESSGGGGGGGSSRSRSSGGFGGTSGKF